MKTKNLTLAAIAFVFAIGSAFASLFTVQNIFVKAKMTSAPDAPTICVDTQQTCDDSGEAICTVALSVSTGSNTATSSSNYRAFKAGCIVPLFNPTLVTKNSNVSIYRLVGEDEED